MLLCYHNIINIIIIYKQEQPAQVGDSKAFINATIIWIIFNKH